MKAGWKATKIGEVCDVVNGGTPKTNVDEYWNGEHLWVTPAEMGNRSTPYISETVRKLSNAGIANCSAQLMPPFSVILSSRAPIGHLVINTRPMATNQGCKGLVPSKLIYYKFIYYYLTSIVVLLNDLGTGATFRELSGGKLKEVPIPLPPLPEQQRIVKILDEAFESIAIAKTNAEKNLQNARAIFESYLNDVFTKKGEGWVERTILECFKVRSGDFLPAKSMDTSGEFDVYGGNGIIGRHNKKNLTGENIIIGRVGAKCGNVRHVQGDIWVTDNAFFISEYLLPFDLDFLTRILNWNQLRNTANQAAQPVISYSTIKNIVIRFPAEKSIQKEYAEKFERLESRTRYLESIYQRKLTALDELKKSLLHKAFSGEL